MQLSLRVLTDVIFIAVLFLTGVFLLREVIGLIYLSRDMGLLVTKLFVIGAPVSLVLSLVAFFSLKDVRYKWYSWVSGIEVFILALIFVIIFNSQI